MKLHVLYGINTIGEYRVCGIYFWTFIFHSFVAFKSFYHCLPLTANLDSWVLRTCMHVTFPYTGRLTIGLTWQTDFSDRRLIRSRRSPVTTEKQVLNSGALMYDKWLQCDLVSAAVNVATAQTQNRCSLGSLNWSQVFFFFHFLPCDIVTSNSVLAHSDPSLWGHIDSVSTSGKPDARAATDPVQWSEGANTWLYSV